ncbi:MAG: hypothetical protein JWM43_2037 [Acidobacteriaceae bacterium]|nr:hypothetical protein [Acidobacteriaceae bacterium]
MHPIERTIVLALLLLAFFVSVDSFHPHPETRLHRAMLSASRTAHGLRNGHMLCWLTPHDPMPRVLDKLGIPIELVREPA